MGWDGDRNHKHQRGSTERPPKRKLATWGRDQMSTAHLSSWQSDLELARLQSSSPSTRTEKQWGKDVVARLRLSAFDTTARHPRPLLSPSTEKGQTFHRSRLGKRGWPVPSPLRPQTRRLHGKPSHGRGSQSGPCFFPGCGMATCPQCAAACMHTDQGLCFESGNGKAHSDPCSGTAVDCLPKHIPI